MRKAQAALAALLCCALLVAGCAQPDRRPAAEPDDATLAQSPQVSLRQEREQLAARGVAIFQVDPTRSLVAITVRRAGSLARLGHDHVVASRDVEGWVAPDAARAALLLPLAQLSVDELALRAEAGLDTQPSASDIAGTRANMQDKVLETGRFPYALVRVLALTQKPDGTQLDIAITLHGVTRRFTVPVRLVSGVDTVEVTGAFEFEQSAFGIAPFSILGGAVAVQDRLALRFDILASRAARPAAPAA